MKTITQDEICLKGGGYYVPQNTNDAYQVLFGTVLVYIIPWKDEAPGRRSFLCSVEPGGWIPSFVYRDMDYQHWRFCLVAAEETKLGHMPGYGTLPLKKKFLIRAGIDNVELEGYENALVDRYRSNLVKEDGYLMRTDREKQKIKNRTDNLIKSVFEKEIEKIPEDGRQQKIYQMTALLCQKTGLPVAPYGHVLTSCGKHASVPEIARISHIPCREVVLEEGWQNMDAGPFIVFFEKNMEPAACVPHRRHGYLLYQDGKKPAKLTKRLAIQCAPKAYMLYRPFPQKEMTGRDFVAYCAKGLRWSDLASLLLMTVIGSLIGLLLPALNQILYDKLIPLGSSNAVIQLCSLIASFMIGNILFSIVKSLASFRLNSHIRYDVQSAVYHRVFELPEHFLRRYESADLAKRITELGDFAGQMVDMAVSTVFSLLISVFYLWRMFAYSTRLSAAAILFLLLFSVFSYGMTFAQIKYQKNILEFDGKSDSMMYQFLQGIEKIRIAGIEEQAIYEYMKPFVMKRQIQTKMGRLANINAAISLISGSIITMALYMIAYQSEGITMGQFVGFNSVFGMIAQTAAGLTEALANCQMLRPVYDRMRGILETAPEITAGKQLPGDIKGNIDMDHLSFSYGEDESPVFNDLSLHIREGEYLGIVGSSGCGKSTLLKLLLGFEQPVSGRIYYDNQDMSDLDLQELRKRFGVVLQDGDLISGSIYENITLTAPGASYKSVERVVAAVGLAEDIAAMPMGLHTVVSENCGTISGGQKQRILIARAVIHQPQIVFFDEATSALDNITQAKVCDTLEKMDATRIVIAHRLSTIQNCGRILVLDQGVIAEQGTYQELMDRKGLFYQLASRQLMEG